MPPSNVSSIQSTIDMWSSCRPRAVEMSNVVG